MRISIDGNIGCGKSSLMKNLEHIFRNIEFYPEPVSDWTNVLEKYYEDQKRWSMSLNTEVLLSFNKIPSSRNVQIIERSPVSCRRVFMKQSIDSGLIHKIDENIFERLYKSLYWEPDYIIYIRTSPEICYHRMMKRGRDCENKVSLEYIRNIHENYEYMISYMSNIERHPSIYEIDGSKSNEEVVKDVIEILNRIINNR